VLTARIMLLNDSPVNLIAYLIWNSVNLIFYLIGNPVYLVAYLIQ
jgi:hypothetical protein